MITKYEDVTSTIVYTEEQFKEMLEFISKHEILGLDLETDGTNPRQDVIMGIGISHLTEGFYLPLFGYIKEEDRIEPIWAPERALQILNALNGKKVVAYNGAFEAGFTLNLNWDFVPHFWCDPMLLLHTLNENLHNYGLKENAENMFGEWARISQDLMLASMKANGGTGYEYYKADTNVLGHYCVWDNCLALAIYLKLAPKLKEENLEAFFFDDEVMPGNKYMVIPMQLNGIRLDMPLLEAGRAELVLDLKQLEQKIQSEIEPLLDLFNEWFLNKEYPPKRTGPFAQTVVDHFAPDSLPRTPGGAYSFTAKNIAAMSDYFPGTSDNMAAGYVQSWLREEYNLRPEEVVEIQRKMHGPVSAFNLLSTDHVGRLFFTKLGEESISKTPTGRNQVNEAFLDSMADKYPWARDLVTYRRLTKISGTYYERIFNESEGGRFYPSYFSHRTTTGRQSGDFQQLPRPLTPEDEPLDIIRKHNNKIRAFFIADENHVFLDADYNSLEVVVFADDSQDEGLFKIIRDGLDFYSEVAIGANGLDGQYSADKKSPNFLKKLRPELRQGAKPYALGFRYGLDPYKLHKDMNWEKATCEAIQRNYFAKWPGLRRRMDELKHEVQTRGYVQSKAGRRRRQYQAVGLHATYGPELMDSLGLYKKYHEEPALYAKVKEDRRKMKQIHNAAFNFPIQSMAASIVTRAGVALSKFLKANYPEAKLVAAIHDQLVVHCPTHLAALIKPEMQRIMETTTQLSVPLQAEPKEARNLRDGH